MARKKAASKTEKTYFDCQFGSYEGVKRFIVKHPGHFGELRVAAPDEASAIAAAGDRWGERWQDYSFYAYCDVISG